jgi:hypothetical protein
MLPPWDSSVRVLPGASFALNEKSGRELTARKGAFRALRGDVLAFGFEVEQSIDVVISRFFFPSNDKQYVQSKLLFDELFLKSPSANFARKIQIFKALSKQPALSSVVTSNLLKNLDNVRDLRNRFAHYPVVFDVVKKGENQAFTANLVCRDKEITLDGTFLKLFQDLYKSVYDELRKVVGAFGTNVNQTEAAEIVAERDR